MELAEYIILFVLVVSMGAGIPGRGDAAMITAGMLAGEGLRHRCRGRDVLAGRMLVRWLDTWSACAAGAHSSTIRAGCRTVA